MRRVMLAGSALVVLVAAGGYVTADVLDAAPGILTRDAAAPSPVPSATTPQDPGPALLPTPAVGDVLGDSGTDAPQPSEEGLAAAVAAASDDEALTGHLGVSVHDAITGAELYGLTASTPRVPASTAKLLAALAVADTLDLGARVPTTVVATPGSSEIVLVARGDMMLADDEGDTDDVAGRAGLGDLAVQVADHLAADGRDTVRLRLDLSFAPGPRIPPTWNPNDVRDGFAGPVVMTGLESRRARAGRAAPTSPETAVAEAFVALLAERGVTATLRPTRTWRTPAPEDAEELGTVESATVGEVLGLALARSDNALAESLVRQAAATAGEPTRDPGDNAAFIRSRLEADGIPTDGMELEDASGLSPGQAVAPATLAAVLVRATGKESPPLREVVAGLPVSGLSGTLSGRFAGDDTDDVLGVPRAKTGTLRAGSSLAGTTVTADGRPLVVVVMADGYPRTYGGTLRARTALDAIVAAVTRCGCR